MKHFGLAVFCLFFASSANAITTLTNMDAVLAGYPVNPIKEGALTIGGILLGIGAIITAVKIILELAKGGAK